VGCKEGQRFLHLDQALFVGFGNVVFAVGNLITHTTMLQTWASTADHMSWLLRLVALICFIDTSRLCGIWYH